MNEAARADSPEMSTADKLRLPGAKVVKTIKGKEHKVRSSDVKNDGKRDLAILVLEPKSGGARKKKPDVVRIAVTSISNVDPA